jgi:hypothetical protein
MSPQDLIQEHRLYLERIVRSGEITPELARAAWDVLAVMRNVVGPDLEIPDAIPGVDGKLFYTWKRDDQYFELEMLPDGTGEFFFRDRTTGEIRREDFRLSPVLPPKAVAQLAEFAEICRLPADLLDQGG